MNPRVSVVSVTYRSYEDTKQFVESVYEHTREPFEFIMAANDPQDHELAGYLAVQEAAGRLKVVWNPSNIGVRAFNQVMRLASTDWVFRCDSDVVIQQPNWTSMMREQFLLSEKEIGSVVAVGTSNTRGHRIARTPNTVETDMIMSNCMLINKAAASRISVRLGGELPRMIDDVARLTQKPEGYVGEHDDLRATLEYARYHAPWWDLNFGGRNERLGYGSDDMSWSLMARWAGLKLVTSRARVQHKDASARPGYEAERHRLVARGFQYMRTSLSLIMNEWRTEAWSELPNRLPVLVDYRQSGLSLPV